MVVVDHEEQGYIRSKGMPFGMISQLRIFEKMKFQPIVELEKQSLQNIPARSGVYVLMGPQGKAFVYPGGDSTIFYIGRSRNLKRRLRDHIRYTSQVITQDRRYRRYYPRYEYAAALEKCFFTYVEVAGRQTEAEVERRLLLAFSDTYRVWPVANGAGTWD